MAKPKSIQCDGQSFGSIKALSEHFGLPKEKVTRRLAQGWSPEQAVGLVKKTRRGSSGQPIEFEGVRHASLADAARFLGLAPRVIAGRVAMGYSREEALRGALKGPHSGSAKSIEFHGQMFASQEALAANYSQTWRAVWKRRQRGWTMEQALGIDPPPPRFRNFEGHAREHQCKEIRPIEGGIEPVPDSHGYKLYLVRNTVNDKVYVGLTIGPLDKRLKQHFAAARRGRKSAFSNAINKHGEQAFRIELLSTDAKTYEELQEQEVQEIARRDSIRNGYNTALGGSVGTAKQITIAGMTFQSFAGAAEAFGVDPTLFALRVGRLKWTPEQAAGIEERAWLGKADQLTIDGKQFKSLSEAAKAYGQRYKTVHSRLRVKGWTVEQALGIEPPPKKR